MGVSSHSTTRSRARGQRGSVLLAVLLVTLLATTLVTGAAYETGSRLARGAALRDGTLALAAAQAGIETAARMAAADGAWRATLGDGLWIDGLPIDEALVSVLAADPEDGQIAVIGALKSSSADPVRFTATALARGVSRSLESTCLPIPHPALRCVGFSATTIALQGVAIEGRLRAGGDVTHAGGATLHGDITTVTGASVAAELDDYDTDVHYAPAALALPAVDFAWFQAAGKRITVPITRTIANAVITPTRNPYGPVSPNGIYWIDAGNATVYFYNSAIEACIAIRNAGEVIVGDWFGNPTYYYHRSPDPDRLPALLVEGDLTMRIEAGGNLGGAGGLVPSITSDLEGVFLCTGTFRGPQLGAASPISCRGSFLAQAAHFSGPGTLLRHRPELDLRPLAELTVPGLRPLPGTTREP